MLDLSDGLAEQLDPSVREQYLKLWRDLRELPNEKCSCERVARLSGYELLRFGVFAHPAEYREHALR